MRWIKLLTRENVDVTTISQLDILFNGFVWQLTKNKNEALFTILKDKKFTHYISVDPYEIGKLAYKKYFNSKKQIIKYYNEGKRLLKKTKKDTVKWAKKLTENPSKDNFLSAFKEFRASFEKICYIYTVLSWFAIEAWQNDFEQILNKLIEKNNLEKHREAIFSTAYRPWKKTALFEIQDKFARGQSVKQLVEEYQFLRSWAVVWYRPITEDWIKDICRSVKKTQVRTYSSKKLLNLLKPNKKEKKFLDMAPYMVFFKDWRDDVRRFHAYHWSFLFDLIAEKLNIERDDIGYLSVDEIEKMLQMGELDRNFINLIEKRKKDGCVVTIAKKGVLKIKVINGIPLKYKNIAREVEYSKQEDIVSGKIAQIGIAKGIVKIIRTYHDIKKVQDGDILVAITTHPNYLPAMKKAAAFVTDEGGIISHAAIVAREMKKPCIVGTKIATKVLKDGDLVEVDANKGIIKIISRGIKK